MITIRPITVADEPFLWDMLYHAIYVPAGQPPVAREFVYLPELRKYVAAWGQPNDLGFLALDQTQPVGASWIRLFQGASRGYGYVDDQTPELTIALLPEFRGQGVGSQLLARLLDAAAARYAAVSLSVSPENPARRLYARCGFEIVSASGDSLTMCKRWH